MTMGERLREKRLAAGLSLTAMASAVGMAPSGYISLENGTVGKTFEKLPIIAKELGCSIDDLFPEMDSPDQAAAAEPADDDDVIPF